MGERLGVRSVRLKVKSLPVELTGMESWTRTLSSVVVLMENPTLFEVLLSQWVPWNWEISALTMNSPVFSLSK